MALVTSKNKAEFDKSEMAKRAGEKQQSSNDEEHYIRHSPTGELLGPYKSKSHAEKSFKVLKPQSEYEHVSQKAELAQDRINKKNKTKSLSTGDLADKAWSMSFKNFPSHDAAMAHRDAASAYRNDENHELAERHEEAAFNHIKAMMNKQN